MARTPKSEPTREEKKAERDNAEQEALLREVDDAVREGDFNDFMASYGKPLLALVVLGLAGFGGYLWWDNQREAEMERASEQLVTAIDHLEAGQNDEATSRLEAITGESTAAISAKLMRAGILAEKGEADRAAALFGEVADDSSAPQTMRNVALIRRTSLLFDTMEPDDVIAAMKPLAVPGEPFFASAGELVAHAYLAQDKRSEAGALFAEIARHEDTPESARARMLNMAGILGVDAVDDVQDVLGAQRSDPEAPRIVGE